MENKCSKILLLNLLKSLIALKLLNQGFQGKKGILRCSKQIFKAFDVLLMYSEKCIHYIWLMSINTKKIHRVLLSTIKLNAEHPCPHCLVKKINTIKMGTELDIRYHRANSCIDDHIRQVTVKNARQLVFEQGIPLSSDCLKEILGKFSGIPTHISDNAHYVFWLI